MKKFKYFSLFSLLILLILPVFFVESLTGFFDLNRVALYTVKNILGKEPQTNQTISEQK